MYTHYNSELRVSGSKRGAVNAIDLLHLHVTEICNQSKFFIFYSKNCFVFKNLEEFPEIILAVWPFQGFRSMRDCERAHHSSTLVLRSHAGMSYLSMNTPWNFCLSQLWSVGKTLFNMSQIHWFETKHLRTPQVCFASVM